MKVLLFSNNPKLLKRWQNALKNFNVTTVPTTDDLQEQTLDNNVVLILDIFSCEGDSISFLKSIIDRGVYVMILDPNPEYENTKQILEIGVRGYGNLMIHDVHLQAALETIIDGDIWLYPDFINQLLVNIGNNNTPKCIDDVLWSTLSEREKEVALRIKDGLTNKEIALKLDITTRTVKSHATHIYEKVGVTNRLSLALLLSNR